MLQPGGLRLCDVTPGDKTSYVFYGIPTKRANQIWVAENDQTPVVLILKNEICSALTLHKWKCRALYNNNSNTQSHAQKTHTHTHSHTLTHALTHTHTHTHTHKHTHTHTHSDSISHQYT